jgi:hypothetical protein
MNDLAAAVSFVVQSAPALNSTGPLYGAEATPC